jgi:hypothetical protein
MPPARPLALVHVSFDSMTSSFEQRIRDAKTILQARWPDRFPLNEREQDIVAAIMVDYAIQCELAILREQEKINGDV